MYHLLKGLHEYLTRKDEYSILILGMAGAGKTTFLEKLKTMYNDTPGLSPDNITPTVGQNMGKITLPSTILQFWDLGGQTGIRSIWPRYYNECHAVAYLVDANDRDLLEEGLEVFDSVFSHPQILDVPLLLLANKQDISSSMSAEEIRESYESWWQKKQNDSGSRDLNRDLTKIPQERMASLNVMGISASEGHGIRDAIDWLFLRVQNGSR